jgi:AcrR family transcriptional regulator
MDETDMDDGKPVDVEPGSTTRARPGRRRRKERTRQLLIDAALDIARQEGLEALTTTRLASAAGITQPGFYVHFQKVEHCLQAAAEQLLERLLDLQREARRLAGSLLTGLDALDKPEVVASAYEGALALAMSERRLVELGLRYRHDPSSAIGLSVNEALDRTRRDMAEDLRRAAQEAGTAHGSQTRYELLADILIWLFLGALEALLRDRYPERAKLIASLAEVTRSVFAAEMAGDRKRETSRSW